MNNLHKTDKEIAELIDRSTESVKTKRKRLKALKKIIYCTNNNVYKLLDLYNVMVKWSEKDIKFVKDNISKLNHYEMAEKLGRTAIAVSKKIRQMELNSNERILLGDKNKWTEEDDNLLIENKDKLIKELMVMFPTRSRESIYGRKRTLGATKYKLWTKKELKIVKNNLDKTDKEIAEMIDRSVTAVASKRKKFKLLKNEPHKLWSEKNEAYLKKNYKLRSEKELAEHCDVSIERVHTKLLDMKLIESKERGLLWSAEDLNKVQEMKENGYTITEICKAFPDRTHHAVAGQVRKFKPPKKEKIKIRYGYVEILINNKSVRLHVYLGEIIAGRKLTRKDNVHHINFDPEDNRISNLLVLSSYEHRHLHSIIHELIQPLLDADYMIYDRSIDMYILIEYKTTFKQRKKIFEDFNNRVNDYADYMSDNQDAEFEKITKSMVEKYGYITSTNQMWNDKELGFLKDNPNLPLITITTVLASRSKNAVEIKLRQIGYNYKKKDSVYMSHGYKIIKVDGKRIPEHVYKAQLILGRKLKGDAVHHINFVKTDNRSENLVIFSGNVDNDGKFISALKKHGKAGGTFNLRVPNLWERGIISYSVASQSYILGENFVANDKNYKRDDTQLLDDLIKFHAQLRKE